MWESFGILCNPLEERTLKFHPKVLVCSPNWRQYMDHLPHLLVDPPPLFQYPHSRHCLCHFSVNVPVMRAVEIATVILRAVNVVVMKTVVTYGKFMYFKILYYYCCCFILVWGFHLFCLVQFASQLLILLIIIIYRNLTKCWTNKCQLNIKNALNNYHVLISTVYFM